MSLPKPYYDCDGITIFHADCRDILPHLPKVDLVLTDPPYGLGDIMQGGTWGAAEKYADFRRWDIAPSSEFLLNLTFNNLAIIWGGNYFSLPGARCWLVWDKRNAVPTMADCEMAWTNIYRPTKRFSWGVGVHNYGHPTEKPVELMKWSIAQCADVTTILDPFMGSGTTLRAAKDLGRKAIGIEIEEKYCEIAVRRLAQEVIKYE
jgi:site-specific DNA-methyltransferase (adenine-specific)